MCVEVSLNGWPGCDVLPCLRVLTGPPQVMIYNVTSADTTVAGAGNPETELSPDLCRLAPFGSARLVG